MGSSEIGASALLLRGILDRQATGARSGRVPPASTAGEPAAFGSEGIERALATLCATPGVKGAAVADASGLTVGGRGGAVEPERMAAYSVALAAALDAAGRFLGTGGRDRAAVRLQGEDEALLQRFVASGRTYHLIVIRDARVAARLDLAGAAAALSAALTDRAGGGARP